jgi:hypothetical protein
MIGWNLKITLDDDHEHEVPVTYAVACAWEDHHPGQAMETMVKEVKFKQIAYLAYQACLKAKVPCKAWPSFIDQLGDVDFIPKGKTKDKQPDS